jgi:hypothetical protein
MKKEYAFPSEGFDSGMTLRDYFAAAAMQSLLNDKNFSEYLVDRFKDLGNNLSWDKPPIVRQYAVTAYEMADAMLHERER